MSDCKTGAEHIKSLKDGRTVYLDGKLVGDVTEHPAFRNAVHSAAALYDFQAQPDNLELMTFRPNGSNRRVNKAWQMPRSYEEMVQRRKALQAWAALSCGYFGRSPDHLASSLVGQLMGIDVFRKRSAERAKAFAGYFDYASKNDLFLTYVIINPQAQRGKDWGEQDEDLVARIVDEDSGGVTIRGAKMLGTSSIMANEVFVANLQPLKVGEEDLAFSCALPMNARSSSPALSGCRLATNTSLAMIEEVPSILAPRMVTPPESSSTIRATKSSSCSLQSLLRCACGLMMT